MILEPCAIGGCSADVVLGGAARAGPRRGLVALVAALLLALLVPRYLREQDEGVLARRLARGRAAVDRHVA